MQYSYWYLPGRARMDGTSRSGGSVAGDDTTDYLSRPDLRRRLEDEASAYRRKIDTYKEAQKQQAELVSRLQAKVLQYKKRCAELEGQMSELESPSTVYAGGGVVGPPGSALEAAQQQLREMREEQFADLSSAVRAVHEERRKYDKLFQNYNALRQQLEEAHESNEALTNDLQKLSSDWEMMREEMLTKEDEWKEEEASFNDYFAQEHSRLLNLWRDVVAMKRQFTEMQSATHRDLMKMRSDFSNAARDLIETSSGMTVKQTRFSAVEDESKQQMEEEMAQLKESMTNLRAEKEKLAYELRTKEEKLHTLMRDCKNLEERCAMAETSIGEINRQHTELDLLQSALRDIAHAVLQDAESREPEAKHHVHLTPSQALPPRSPKRGARTPTSPAFVESTISAVQAALNKYQLNIHEAQVKLAASKEQAASWKRQYETMEDSHKILESRLSEVTAQLDSLKIQLNQMSQERDMVSKSLEVARAEKYALDKNRLELNAMMDNVNAELEKERKSNIRYSKLVESLEDEKSFLHSEIDRLNKDAELRPSETSGFPARLNKVPPRGNLIVLSDPLKAKSLTKESTFTIARKKPEHPLSAFSRKRAPVVTNGQQFQQRSRSVVGSKSCRS